jgi:dihydrofolate synthase/folylpolyglutamate synthase
MASLPLMSPTSATDDPILPQRDAAQHFLDSRIDYERVPAVPYGEYTLKLERIHQLLDRLDNPHRAYPIVHVAGTKGKGSTSVMVGSVLSAAGYQTGVFTSPHLDRVEERIAVDGRPCCVEDFIELVGRVAPQVEAMDAAAGHREDQTGPTYFEIVTAMAMLHFAQQKVDMAVLEVGLGGRLDATNVCQPRVSAITSIGFDHTRQLGKTLEAIAGEKAGIVKPGVPLISGVVRQEPRDVIRRICRERGAPLVELGTDFDFRYQPPRGLEQAPSLGSIDFRTGGEGREFQYEGLSLGLVGHHQAVNAAVALSILGELKRQGFAIPDDAIRLGLARAACPARVEMLGRRPTVILDSAHNVASVEALLQVVSESFTADRRLLIFATTKGKDVRNMLRPLLEQFDTVLFTQYVKNPRAVPPEELGAMAADLTGNPYRTFSDPADAWNEARSLAAANDLICVTGSFFIAAEMRHHICECPASFAPSAEKAIPFIGP